MYLDDILEEFPKEYRDKIFPIHLDFATEDELKELGFSIIESEIEIYKNK